MITMTDVDGIPVLQAATVGSMRAGLSFRVGQADEPLARRGITHLVEHLALHKLGLADYHYNGATGVSVTHFYTQGSATDVVGYLHAVCAGLADLPMDRVETEKSILRTEASGRGRSVLEPMAVWRYGARGFGAVGYPEWGLNAITPDDLRAWVARYFTRQNAVLWVAGDIPPGLRLSLPEGARAPLPVVTSALPTTPAFFTGGSRSTSLEAIVRRRPAAQLFAEVLERELFRSLRQEAGLSYTAATNYEPRGDDFAAIVALADALEDKQGAVLGGFIDVLAKLRVGRIDQADLDAVLTQADEALGNPDIDAARLPGLAFDYLTGRPVRETWEVRHDLHQVGLAEVGEVAVEAWGTALLMTPENSDALWAGFAAAPVDSSAPAEGTSYKRRGGGRSTLVIGPDAAGIVGESGALTVRYVDCEALLGWPDGGRVLIGADGISVQIEPTLFDVAPAALARVEAAVPVSRRVMFPPRDPDDIPQPKPVNAPVGSAAEVSAIPERAAPFPTAPVGVAGPPAKASVAASAPALAGSAPPGGWMPVAPRPAGVKPGLSTGRIVALVIMGLVAVLSLCLGASFLVSTPDQADRGSSIALGGCGILVAAVLAVGAILLARRPKS